MKSKKIKRILLIVLGLLVVFGLVAFFIANQPHRNVQQSSTDYILSATDLVNEYLENPDAANQKYLDEEGESKILEVTGKVKSVTKDFDGNSVVLLQSEGDKAGVKCYFVAGQENNISGLAQGVSIKVKGVIQAGPSYDEDLGLYEDAVLDKCVILN